MIPPARAAGHDLGETLYLPGDSPVHRLPAHVKLVTTGLFILIVVVTPAAAGWVFCWYAGLIASVALVAQLPPGRVLRRMTVELPFVAFALVLPFVGRPPTTEFLGLTLSQPGLWAAWNILAKATIGVATSVVLAATTPSRDLLDGLARLRVPALLVEIASFMLRYVHLVSDQWRRMTMARASRGFEVSGVRGWPTLARSAGVLFLRSYERGERVHLAMLSRGYTGAMPLLDIPQAAPRQWAVAAVLPACALAGLFVTAVGVGW